MGGHVRCTTGMQVAHEYVFSPTLFTTHDVINTMNTITYEELLVDVLGGEGAALLGGEGAALLGGEGGVLRAEWVGRERAGGLGGV